MRIGSNHYLLCMLNREMSVRLLFRLAINTRGLNAGFGETMSATTSIFMCQGGEQATQQLLPFVVPPRTRMFQCRASMLIYSESSSLVVIPFLNTSNFLP